MRRRCDSCTELYEPKRSNSRFCSEACRKRASRRRDDEQSASKRRPRAGETRKRVQSELAEAGRAETYLGAIALALADRVDQSTAVMGYAALTKELRATMDAALAGAQVAADPLDELRARRDRKFAG